MITSREGNDWRRATTRHGANETTRRNNVTLSKSKGILSHAEPVEASELTSLRGGLSRRGNPVLPFHHPVPQNDEISFNVMLDLKKHGPATTGYTYQVTRSYKGT